MAKFLQRLFSGSSKRSFRGSQTSIHEHNQQTSAGSNIRSASSLDNLSSYHINPRELDKNKLHKASWEGNLHKVERLARPGLIDQQDQHARTPLHLAVARGHGQIIQRLIHEGARLNIVDEEQRTPLVKAVLSSHQNPPLFYQICVVLLEGGATAFINAVDINGKNALHYAIETENENLVNLFLSVRACDPNFRDRDQMTPLQLAVKANNPNMIQLLLAENREVQADPNLTNRNGQTALHMAASMGYIEIINELLQSDVPEPCDPTIVDARQLTAYQLAKENNHEACARLIDEYQKGWTKLSPRREISESINENEINPMMNPSSRYMGGEVDDEESSSESTESSEEVRNNKPLMNSNKQENQTLASMIRSNPLQAEASVKYESGQPNSTLASLIKGAPLYTGEQKATGSKPTNSRLTSPSANFVLQPNEQKTNASKPTNSTLASLVKGIPLQPGDTSSNTLATTTQRQKTSLFDTGLPSVQHKESDSLSHSITSDKSPFPTNYTPGQPSSPKKNVTISSMINALPHPEPADSNSNSWTYDKSSTYRKEPNTKRATRISESDNTSDQESDDDVDNHHHHHDFRTQNQLPPPPLFNPASVFGKTNIKEGVNNSDSDEDSIEAAFRQHNSQQASLGIQNLVNTKIGTTSKPTQQPTIPTIQSPVSEDYLWSASTKAITKEPQPQPPPPPKGISSLVQNQPLLNRKISQPSWDDSRPLSADLERLPTKPQSQTSSTSSDTDSEQDKKSSTIIRAPQQNATLSNLIQHSMRPSDLNVKPSTGVENLIKIIESIQQSSKASPIQPTLNQTIGKIIGTPLRIRNDSSSSNASTYNETTTHTFKPTGNIITRQEQYHDEVDKFHWHPITNDQNEFKQNTDKYPTDMILAAQRQTSRASMHPEFNSLRGSMSSSTSSIQNNMDRLSELKEDIKQIERKQEDSLELKRQLKDMEIKKNNFEALYKKNDQLLRETETKLEKEISEKQRLEWATKNLNMELKSIKQKLQSLEEEKDILNQRCVKLKEERDNYDEKLRIHQANTLQTAAAGVLREEDIEKIKVRHRDEMKLLSAENEDLHQRTKQLQSDLQLHKESLDVTIRYKIDLEKALEEKTYLQHELDRLKHEKDIIEQEKIDYKAKYDNLQEEIRAILLDRSKLEQKLTNELQEQMKQRQRSTDDTKKYKTQIEQLNLKLGDAEARLLVLQTQNEALLASKDRDIKNEFETLTQRLNMIESEKINAEQRFHNEQKDIASKQQHRNILQEPLVILTSTPLNNAMQHSHSSSSPCTKCDTLQRSYEQEREHRMQTEKDNERLRDVVSRQKHQHDLNKSMQHHQEYENAMAENSKQIRSETERVKYELDRLRHDFDKLVSNYEPPNNLQQQAQLHSQIDTLRQFYEQEFRQKLLLSKLSNGASPAPLVHSYHRTTPPLKHDEYDHSINGSVNCSVCSNSRLLKERLENAIDTSLADHRIQAIKQIPILPRLTSPIVANNNNNAISSFDLLRKRYYV